MSNQSHLSQHYIDYLYHADALSKLAEDKPIPVKFNSLMGENLTALDMKDRVCFVMLLQIKHSSMASSSLNYSSLQRTGNGVKRQKLTNNNIPWDRMYVFADLLDVGSCLIIMMQKTRSARDFMRVVHRQGGGILTGGIFALFEPTPTHDRKKLGSMSIVESNAALVPLKNYTMVHRTIHTIPKYMPSSLDVGSQKYFAIHNCITLSIPFFRIDNSYTCQGRECDKAHKIATNQHCGCTLLSSIRNVGVMTLVFKNPFDRANIDVHEFVQVHDFRSLRTTNIFFKDLEHYAAEYSDSMQKDLRKRVSAMVNYINGNGGWTMVGWFRKGETIEDVATNDTDRVESDSVVIHISYLVPTNDEIMNNTEYKVKLVDADQQNGTAVGGGISNNDGDDDDQISA